MIANDPQVGERRTFRSSLEGTDGAGLLVRLYTGQVVEVIGVVEDVEVKDGAEYDERLMVVRANDGKEFHAWETELVDHAQSHYYLPDGTLVADTKFKFEFEAGS